jgi:hypothetical protein
LNDFSEPRYKRGARTFAIVTFVAPPGTGKSRLLDDTVRGQIAAVLCDDGVPTQLFDPSEKLLLAITFNGGTTKRCVHQVASRCLLEFFCGQPEFEKSADEVLGRIDVELAWMFPGRSVAEIETAVINALEELFFRARDRPMGRTVLLVDEINLVGDVVAQDDLYRLLVGWIDAGGVLAPIGAVGRRGAVFSGVTISSPWARECECGRTIVQLALGRFDVWDKNAQMAVMRTVNAHPPWAHLADLPDQLWCLFAATGGRPRDIEGILTSLSDLEDLSNVTPSRLMTELFNIDPSGAVDVFSRYLLPSMVSLPLYPQLGDAVTQFGRDIASRALHNADLLAAISEATKSWSAAPSVSLRFSKCLRGSIHSAFLPLVEATTFYTLRGNGKDFEHVWVLLLQMHLLLQFNVRQGTDCDQFWPQATPFVPIGGRPSPSGDLLDVFARGGARESALFAKLDENRIYEVGGSTVHRKLQLKNAEPPVMLWENLWTGVVRGANQRELPRLFLANWHATTDVVWQSPALVYFSLRVHKAIDFMLLAGEANGSGAAAPHIYMFQCKAWCDSVAAAAVQQMVDDLDVQLDVLLSPACKRNVLRRAGVDSKNQVTLCIAALKFGDNFTFKTAQSCTKKKLIVSPFNVALFDAAQVAALGGAALSTTRFMHDIQGKLARKC